MARSFGTLRNLDQETLDEIRIEYEIPATIDLEAFIQATAFVYDQGKITADKPSPSEWEKGAIQLSGAIRKLTDLMSDPETCGANLVYKELDNLLVDWSVSRNKDAFEITPLPPEKMVKFLDIARESLDRRIKAYSKFNKAHPEHLKMFKNGIWLLTQGTRFPHLFNAFEMMRQFWKTLPKSKSRGNFTHYLIDALYRNKAIEFTIEIIGLIDVSVSEETIVSQFKKFSTRMRRLKTHPNP